MEGGGGQLWDLGREQIPQASNLDLEQGKPCLPQRPPQVSEMTRTCAEIPGPGALCWRLASDTLLTPTLPPNTLSHMPSWAHGPHLRTCAIFSALGGREAWD